MASLLARKNRLMSIAMDFWPQSKMERIQNKVIREIMNTKNIGLECTAEKKTSIVKKYIGNAR